MLKLVYPYSTDTKSISKEYFHFSV